MRIFAAVVTTIILGAFGHRIQEFLRENILGRLLRQFSHNHNVRTRITGNTEKGEEASTPSASSTITTTGSEFDVFLSFRGEDTRKGFTGHLYEGLQLRGVSTFKDDVNLDKGKEIDRLLEYIEKSKIFVVILSEHFAESRWCLKEVTKSMECGKEIVPVFFGVEPSDVRNQSGPFKSAFKKHESNKKENQEEVTKWREALKIVGNLSGFTLKEKNGDETELKLAIIQKVLDKVNRKPFEVAKHPVGIETRLEVVVKMLKNESINGVHVVGICGMGGLGKTTIARAVYNKYLTKGFKDAGCFLSNIREKSGQPNGLVDLQKQFIEDLFKQKDISLGDVAQGKILIRDKVKDKRVLLILDDIDSREQLNALAGERVWYGTGSVIIITTRDKNILLAHNVKEHEIYEPAELNEEQSQELFLKHAFNGQEPKGDYLQLSKEAAVVASGLPLTLEVLGSLLTCDMHIQEWKYTLEKLKNIPPQEVLQRLKLSYNRLNKYEQEIFLDISCFFIGRRIEYVTYMWEGRHFFPKHAIRVLEQRSLIKINEKSGEFWMHDQIRDMGRAIVEEESSRKAEKQSRLWNSEDSLNLLQRKVPTGIAVEGIQIDCWRDNIIISADCFQNMPNLRYFKASSMHFQGMLDCFPSNLKWLELSYCQFDDSTPFDHLNLEQLVILQLHDTNSMAQILVQPLQFKAFEKLKVLDIYGPTIEISPDFTNTPCLVELSLFDLALTTIDESIGKLKDLAYLEIKLCRQLEKLPDSIVKLKNLERLSLCNCSHLYSLPEKLGDMENLREIILDGIKIEVIPDSVGKLKKLERLSLEWCPNLFSLPERLGDMENLREVTFNIIEIKVIPESIGQLKNLERLSLKGCFNLYYLPERLGDLESLRELIIELAEIEAIPDSVGQLKNLERLSLQECYKLCSLPERLGDMENLRELIVEDTKIKVIPDSVGQLKNLERLSLKECRHLCSLPERLGDVENLRELILNSTKIEVIPDSVGQLKKLERLYVEGCRHIKKLPSSIAHLVVICEFTGSSCELIELSDRWYKSLKDIELIDDRIKELPDCIKEMENLKKLSLSCEMLTTFPNWMEQLSERLTKLSVKGKHLAALPDCVGKFYQLQQLSLECENFEALPDFIGTLQNLTMLSVNSKHLTTLPDCVGMLYQLEKLSLECENFSIVPDLLGQLANLKFFSLKCKNLIHLPATIHESWRELEFLILSGCEKLEDLTAATSIQQKESMAHLLSLKCIVLDDCKRLEYLPELSSSLCMLSASACTNLRKISDVSYLTKLAYLDLNGCKLLEDVSGLENISNKLELLRLPGPCDLIACCSFSQDFKNKVFKEMNFACLDIFGISGSMETGLLRGQQKLHFMTPRLPFYWLQSRDLTLKLEKVDSPVHVEIMADDVRVFEKSLELSNYDFSGEISLEEEGLVNIGEGYEKHCYTILVTTAQASQLQRVELFLE